MQNLLPKKTDKLIEYDTYKKEGGKKKKLRRITFNSSSSCFPSSLQINLILMSGRVLVAALAAAVLMAGAGE